MYSLQFKPYQVRLFSRSGLIVFACLILAACQVKGVKVPYQQKPQRAISSTSMPPHPLNPLQQPTTTPTGQTEIEFSQSTATLLPITGSTPTLLVSFSMPTSHPRNFSPNSEIIYSPTAKDFDVKVYLDKTPGFLKSYRQYLMITGWTGSAEVISRVALENSINPRLLLALLEYQSGCVLGNSDSLNPGDYLLHAWDYRRKDLYGQLIWAVQVISKGYYSWRTGELQRIPLQDGTNMQLASDLNAGTAALYYFFAQLEKGKGADQILASAGRFMTLHESMFGDPWQRAQTVEPLFPPDLSQPTMVLPFQTGSLWSLTAGPHPAWERSQPLAALDFAPASAESGCTNSKAWVVAAADGLVVRSEFGLVVQDLDGDGYEQTGWVILYMHIDRVDRVPPGTFLHTDDIIGHPSCNGGRATGTHVHIARKYNGEWVPAGGSLPFVLSDWVAHDGLQPFQGTLTKKLQSIRANQYGTFESQITR